MMSRSWQHLCGLALTITLICAPALSEEISPPVTKTSVDIVDEGIESLSLTLPLNKARIIELPVAVRDVLVTNPDIADVVIKTPTQIYLLGQDVGDTNAYFFDEEGRQIARIELRVELDLTPLKNAYKELMPGENIKVSAVNRNVVLTGTLRSAAAVENARLLARRFTESDDQIINLVKMLSEQQVLIRVRVSEMSRSVVKQLGINMQAIFAPSNDAAVNLDFGLWGCP